MKLLDRYVVWQLLPVWIWCLAVFLFLTCLIDLFGHLDEILRYKIAAETVITYYLNFLPIVFVRASPLALLLSCAFVGSTLSKHRELLAMHASGTSRLRASIPFLFVGWMATLIVFAVNDRILPKSASAYEHLRQEAFRGRRDKNVYENVAVIDSVNRLYHARELRLKEKELRDLTVLEHDRNDRPIKSVYANRAIWTPHGWLLLHGRIYRVGPGGRLQGEPQPFVERLIRFPVNPKSFSEPAANPETMSFGRLRRMISQLKHMGMHNIRRYKVELISKLTLPFLNLAISLIAFVGSTSVQSRGNLRGLGASLGWGMVYYLGVATFHGIAKQWPVPIVATLFLPHIMAILFCARRLRAVD